MNHLTVFNLESAHYISSTNNQVHYASDYYSWRIVSRFEIHLSDIHNLHYCMKLSAALGGLVIEFQLELKFKKL